MSRRVVDVTLDDLEDLPERCRSCVRWELERSARAQAEDFGETALEKEAWILRVLLEWGSCGRIVHLDGKPAGFALYAPPSAVPGAAEFPTAPVSADAVLLTGMRVLDGFEDGLGRLLVQHVARDLTRRGVWAVEAFGDSTADGGECALPTGFLQRVGFKPVRDHPRWPRLRLELRTALDWKHDVEAALDRLFDEVTVTGEPLVHGLS